MSSESYGLPIPEWYVRKHFKETSKDCVAEAVFDDEEFQFILPPGTQIKASKSGRVIQSKESHDLDKLLNPINSHLTNLIIIKGNKQISEGYSHVYPTVEAGEFVQQGQPIGRLVESFPAGKSPHLHFLSLYSNLNSVATSEIKFEPYSLSDGLMVLPGGERRILLPARF